MDIAAKTRTDAAKTASERVVQKTAEATQVKQLLQQWQR